MVAAICSDDEDHSACAELIRTTQEPIVLPELTLPEIDYWINKWVGPQATLALLEDIQAGAYAREATTADDYRRAQALIEKHGREGVGLVDASILATVERLGETKLATLDRRHFSVMQPRHVDALTLLPQL